MALNTLPTGIQILDERLDGGIAAGSVVAFTAEPASQAERFLAQLTHPRPTTYLTAQRTVEAVETSLQLAGGDMDDGTIRRVPPEQLKDAYQPVRELSEPSTLIIDSMTPFETVERTRLWSFMNALQSQIDATGSLAFLHCLDGNDPPPRRDTTEYMADVVFELETSVYGDTIENRLFIPKSRRGTAVNQAIKLDLTAGVTIDTSRDIS